MKDFTDFTNDELSRYLVILNKDLLYTKKTLDSIENLIQLVNDELNDRVMAADMEIRAFLDSNK